MIFCDSHIHLSHSQIPKFAVNEKYFCVSSCHNLKDFLFLGRSMPSATFFDTPSIASSFASYGIHPQAVNASFMENQFNSELVLIENLLKSKQITAIGECGFDFFTQEYKSTALEQEKVFDAQLNLALCYNIPLVLHLRKSIEKIFSYTKELKKLPAVIFHSFPGTLHEAVSLKAHGVNTFFSFGKPLLNGKKSALDCVSNLPAECLLLETDAPYQTLKGESETFPHEIKRVYEKVCELRKIPLEELSEQIFQNFCKAFLIQDFKTESVSV
ncbi:TatD family hydrolase [Treponema sp.]|uniref:TatD family hydrolase n=1 Tax=Treponema sp. TaxID=166 RepID=UPI00388D6A95